MSDESDQYDRRQLPLERATAIELGPADIVVVTMPQQMNRERLNDAKRFLAKLFPRNRVVLIGDQMRLDVYRERDRMDPLREAADFAQDKLRRLIDRWEQLDDVAKRGTISAIYHALDRGNPKLGSDGC